MSETTEPTPSASESPAERQKVTKRQPCPCGSGKKFKACCIDDPRYELVTEIGAPLAEPPAHLAQASKGGPGPKAFGNVPPRAVQNQRPSNATHRRRV